MDVTVFPPWFLWIIAATGIAGGIAMIIQFAVYHVRKSWGNGNGNGNKKNGSIGLSTPPFVCPVDNHFLSDQLGQCHNHREAAAERDARMLSMLKSLLDEIRGMRQDTRDLNADIRVLKDRSDRR